MASTAPGQRPTYHIHVKMLCIQDKTSHKGVLTHSLLTQEGVDDPFIVYSRTTRSLNLNFCIGICCPLRMPKA